MVVCGEGLLVSAALLMKASKKMRRTLGLRAGAMVSVLMLLLVLREAV